MFRAYHSLAGLACLVAGAAAAQAAEPVPDPSIKPAVLWRDGGAPIEPANVPPTANLDLDAAAADADEASAPSLIGPPLPIEPVAAPLDPDRMAFGRRAHSVRYELLGAVAVLTATNVPVVINESQPFRFTSEGFFGRDTGQLGVDKLAHAWNTYVFTDLLYRRMARKTGGGRGAALTAAALGIGLQTYGEIYDGIHRGSGFSFEDMAFNALGAGFSILRHTGPKLRDKIDYRLMFVPDNKPFLRRGGDRFEQQWFLLAVKGSGFGALRQTPLRLVELHLGYHAKDFSGADRAAGLTPQRKPFVGVGFNLSEAFLKRRRGPVADVARTALEYLQPPYISAHID